MVAWSNSSRLSSSAISITWRKVAMTLEEEGHGDGRAARKSPALAPLLLPLLAFLGMLDAACIFPGWFDTATAAAEEEEDGEKAKERLNKERRTLEEEEEEEEEEE